MHGKRAISVRAIEVLLFFISSHLAKLFIAIWMSSLTHRLNNKLLQELMFYLEN